MFKITGTLQYDPPRDGLKNQPGRKQRTDWWAVVHIPRDITRYYRWLTAKNIPGLKLYAPAWDAHVSVIRGERPSQNKINLWKKYEGERIDMWYDTDIQCSDIKGHGVTSGKFWFVEVVSPRLAEIRQEFGFPTNWKFHLTFARTWLIDPSEQSKLIENMRNAA